MGIYGPNNNRDKYTKGFVISGYELRKNLGLRGIPYPNNRDLIGLVKLKAGQDYTNAFYSVSKRNRFLFNKAAQDKIAAYLAEKGIVKAKVNKQPSAAQKVLAKQISAKKLVPIPAENSTLERLSKLERVSQLMLSQYQDLGERIDKHHSALATAVLPGMLKRITELEARKGANGACDSIKKRLEEQAERTDNRFVKHAQFNKQIFEEVGKFKNDTSNILHRLNDRCGALEMRIQDAAQLTDRVDNFVFQLSEAVTRIIALEKGTPRKTVLYLTLKAFSERYNLDLNETDIKIIGRVANHTLKKPESNDLFTESEAREAMAFLGYLNGDPIA